MQFKLRSVNTKIWDDPFVEELKSEEKLLFIYLLTNPLTNMLGIYEISVKRIAYDTGLTEERVNKSLKVFQSLSKVYYRENYIILPNFLKNQNLNTNMQKGALNLFKELPKWLKDSIIDKPLKAFESLRNAMLNMNMNMNMNMNNEREKEKEKKEDDIIQIVFPFDSEEFLKWWNLWKEYKSKEYKFKYKSHISEQAALKKLSELSRTNEEIAIAIIFQSMSNGWAGLFELKQPLTQSPQARAAQRDKAGKQFAKTYGK